MKKKKKNKGERMKRLVQINQQLKHQKIINFKMKASIKDKEKKEEE